MPRSRLQTPPGARRTSRPSWLLGVFFAAALLFMLAAAGIALAAVFSGSYWLHWLALHLLFLGGVSQLVLGAAQFFVCAFLATDPPPRRLIWAQLATWNAGTVLVAIGVPTSTTAFADSGAALIAVGLVLFTLALAGMQRRSLQHAPWALRWYLASAACLGMGALLGVLMARGTTWSYGSLLGAHLTLNLGGWLGTAIVGTLHTLYPSLTQTRLRYPQLQRPTCVLWLTGIVSLAIGAAFASDAGVAAGWSCLLVAATLLAVNVLMSLRSGVHPAPLPARLLALGQAFLAAGLLIGLVTTLHAGAGGPFTGAARPVLAVLLAAGWIGMTVTGALLHLLAILGRIRNFAVPMAAPRPVEDRAVTLAAGAAVVALALSHVPGMTALGAPAVTLTTAVACFFALRVLALASRAARGRQVRPSALRTPTP